ncbi:MAG TPA: glycyl-radical enzyme activating protein [Deltaproteobacteria bacterium]|nr:glycyl-radical enzyme activating protein [Deltaproteobacteria bacterium]
MIDSSEPAALKDRALIFEVKGNSLDDGPGIRTVVFFKGCPLNCVWCHNPESKKAQVEISFDREKCIGCGSCLAACPENALDKAETSFIDRKRCTLCMECTRACPSGALSQVGRYLHIDELMAEIEKDIPFFRASAGGITLSGGEPSLYMDFSSNLLQRAKLKEIHTLVETCGFFDYRKFMEALYPFLDTIYYDIKIFDPTEHKRLCGAPNEKILENFKLLAAECSRDGKELLPRIPLIPGTTATSENLTSIARFLKESGSARVELLSYNPLWLSKLSLLGQSAPCGSVSSPGEWMPVSQVEQCRKLFSDFQIK